MQHYDGQVPDTIVTARVSASRLVVPGSVRKECSACKEPVWLAPFGQGVLLEYPLVRLMCLECVSVLAEVKALDIVLPSQEAIAKEVLPLIRRN